MLKIKSVSNFRELGGIINKDGKMVKPSLLYRCGHFNKINKRDIARLKLNGVKDIIDLRCDIEVREQPDKQIEGIVNHHIQILTPEQTGVSTQDIKLLTLLRTLPAMEPTYINMAREKSCAVQFEKVIRVIMNAEGAVAYHCTAGKDRTGITTLILLTMLDVDLETIIENYLLTNKVNKKMANLCKVVVFLRTFNIKYVKNVHKLFNVYRSYIELFMEEINKTYGSFDNYIENGLHITKEEREVFKNKMLVEV